MIPCSLSYFFMLCKEKTHTHTRTCMRHPYMSTFNMYLHMILTIFEIKRYVSNNGIPYSLAKPSRSFEDDSVSGIFISKAAKLLATSISLLPIPDRFLSLRKSFSDETIQKFIFFKSHIIYVFPRHFEQIQI